MALCQGIIGGFLPDNTGGHWFVGLTAPNTSLKFGLSFKLLLFESLEHKLPVGRYASDCDYDPLCVHRETKREELEEDMRTQAC